MRRRSSEEEQCAKNPNLSFCPKVPRISLPGVGGGGGGAIIRRTLGVARDRAPQQQEEGQPVVVVPPNVPDKRVRFTEPNASQAPTVESAATRLATEAEPGTHSVLRDMRDVLGGGSTRGVASTGDALESTISPFMRDELRRMQDYSGDFTIPTATNTPRLSTVYSRNLESMLRSELGSTALEAKTATTVERAGGRRLVPSALDREATRMSELTPREAPPIPYLREAEDKGAEMRLRFARAEKALGDLGMRLDRGTSEYMSRDPSISLTSSGSPPESASTFATPEGSVAPTTVAEPSITEGEAAAAGAEEGGFVEGLEELAAF